MDVSNKKILIVDSDTTIQKLLKKRLTNIGFNVILTTNEKEALFLFNKEAPCLVVFDIMLPNLDGYEFCQKIRENSKVPIIILSSRDNISDRIKGLEQGADDYLVKPFFPKELEARIKSLLRRSSFENLVFAKKKQRNIQISKSLFIDLDNKLIIKNNHNVKLTNIEYCILELLVKNAGNNLSRAFIINKVWGYTPERYIDNRIVDVHISRLRSKIEEDPTTPDLIITIRGIGYLFRDYIISFNKN